jgi:HEAT repeat protein
MEVTDHELIELLTHDRVQVRSAAIDALSSSSCEDNRMLLQVFAAWDRFGIEQAFPDFALLGHLPVSHHQAEASIHRAGEMSRDRKLIDPICRFAGKLIEAYSIASPKAYSGLVDSFEALRSQSKIFFRVDIDQMRRRLQVMQLSSDQLRLMVRDSYQLEPLEVDQSRLRFAIDELNERDEADDIWQNVFDDIATDVRTPMTEAAMSIMTRRKVNRFNAPLVWLLSHKESSIADMAVICLARMREPATLEAIEAGFDRLSNVGRLRCAMVLQRLRTPGTTQLLERLIEKCKYDSAACESMKVASLMQFDMSAIEDWLELYLTVEDDSLNRFKYRLPLIIPLIERFPEHDRARIVKLIKSRDR